MIKLTKTELRGQQVRLNQLGKYLPTLQLKKALLQVEVNAVEAEIDRLNLELKAALKKASRFAQLFTDRNTHELFSAIKIVEVQKRYENIAGIDIPVLDKVVFQSDAYFLFDAPVWIDSAIAQLHDLMTIRERIKVAEEKRKALAKELREVSIRVNLFEKIMIPRTVQNIKRIKVFLSDQQLAAVSQAKVSKGKILKRQMMLR